MKNVIFFPIDEENDAPFTKAKALVAALDKLDLKPARIITAATAKAKAASAAIAAGWDESPAIVENDDLAKESPKAVFNMIEGLEEGIGLLVDTASSLLPGALSGVLKKAGDFIGLHGDEEEIEEVVMMVGNHLGLGEFVKNVTGRVMDGDPEGVISVVQLQIDKWSELAINCGALQKIINPAKLS